ncbi:MAG: hypothetical protein L0G87_00315, partial [Renibacterium salmoninarum]|nr:hypothetical protein [Renibacterium salmoninarum]
MSTSNRPIRLEDLRAFGKISDEEQMRRTKAAVASIVKMANVDHSTTLKAVQSALAPYQGFSGLTVSRSLQESLNTSVAFAAGLRVSDFIASLNRTIFRAASLQDQISAITANVGISVERLSRIALDAQTVLGYLQGTPSMLRPPNWRGVEEWDLEKIYAMTMDEGLALGWVPERRLLRRLIAADSGAARRKIIGSSSESIVADCLSQISGVDGEFRRFVPFVAEAGALLQQGFLAGSQALSTTVMDSILHQLKNRFDITSQKGDPTKGMIPFAAVVTAGVWGTYRQYRPPAEPIP